MLYNAGPLASAADKEIFIDKPQAPGVRDGSSRRSQRAVSRVRVGATGNKRESSARNRDDMSLTDHLISI